MEYIILHCNVFRVSGFRLKLYYKSMARKTLHSESPDSIIDIVITDVKYSLFKLRNLIEKSWGIVLICPAKDAFV